MTTSTPSTPVSTGAIVSTWVVGDFCKVFDTYQLLEHRPCGNECVSKSNMTVSDVDRNLIRQERQTLALSPSLQIASQSNLDCSEAHGLVNSI